MTTQDRRLENLISKVNVVENKIDAMQADIRRLYHAVMESDGSLMTRSRLHEDKIKELEKNHWWLKSAIGTALLGFIFDLVFFLSTNGKK